MNYAFDTEDAAKYGTIEAIILSNVKFWLVKNKANNINFFDERTWTYNSVDAFGEMFYWLSASQIKRSLASLVKKGALIKGNYNKSTYDRTTWYALKNLCDEEGLGIGRKQLMERTKTANGLDENSQPIPDSKQQIVNTDKGLKDLSSNVVSIFDYWVLVMQKNAITKLTAKRKTNVTNRLKDGYTVEQIKSAIDGCKSSSFHMGANNDGKVYDDLELICRTGEKLEGFAELAIDKKKPLQSAANDIAVGSLKQQDHYTAKTRKNIAVAQAWLNEG